MPTTPSCSSKARAVKVSEWTRTLRQLELKSTTKLVGFVLATYADYDTGGNAYPGEERLAADCNITTRCCRTHLKILRECGLVERRERPHGQRGVADTYCLRMPADPSTLPRTPDHPALR
jgi:hypothetical protein